MNGIEPRVGALGRLAGAAYRRRRFVVVGWLLAVVAAVGAGMAFSGEFKADYTVKGSDSRAAQDLLAERMPELSGESIDLVVRSSSGPVTAARGEVEALLGQIATVPHVRSADSPYGQPGAISPDGTTLRASVMLDVPNPDAMPVADTQRIVDLAAAADRPGLEVAVGGQAVALSQQGSIGSEGIGLAAAAVILLLVFGSVVAAGLPILVAIVGLGVSASLVGVVAAAIDVPEWSTALATMMGIGVGVDYVLLMVTRYREYLGRGLSPRAATMATADTAGRSVLVAGTTVVVSLLGLFATGLTAMQGAALVTIIAVLVVMAAAITLLPALLGFVGYRIDRLRLPGLRAPSAVAPGSGFAGRWARLVQRRPWWALVSGVVVLGVLALPFLGVRYGFPDAGNDKAGTSTRQAYDMLGSSFGPGANGPLLLVSSSPAELSAVRDTVAGTPGVASVSPVRVGTGGDAAVLVVQPASSPQSPETEALVRTLRSTVDDSVHVGGVTAAAIDSTSDTASRLPLLVGGVVGLSFLLLIAVFRSVAVAVKAAVLNLLSLAAAFGVVALVLQGGWAGQLIGIDTETPLPAFIPVLMFAVLFGLSMDYEVFLVSRIREHWLRTGDNSGSVAGGLAATARVVTAAAAIMIAVFAAFVPAPEVFLKVIGVGMAAAILVDATVVRMLLVPAVMQLLGRATWWLPRWLDRSLPHVRVEGADDHGAPAESPRVLQPA